MKKTLLIIAVFSMLTSCSPTIYYQMYHTKPVNDNIIVNENTLIFEDEHCVILYDFWGEYGDFGFLVYNKGDENIYIHLDECFFVVNGFAYDYYQNRIYSNSSSSVASTTNSYSLSGSNSSTFANVNASSYSIGTITYGNAYGSGNTYKNGYIGGFSNTYVSSSSKSVSTAEKMVVCIPPQNKKIISEFCIRKSLYRDCDIFLYPKKTDKYSLSFDSSEESPYVFGNKLAYSVGESPEMIRIINEFYVSEISNYPIEKITKLVPKSNCGRKIEGQNKRVFTQSGPDRFYIEYNYNTNTTYIEH